MKITLLVVVATVLGMIFLVPTGGDAEAVLVWGVFLGGVCGLISQLRCRAGTVAVHEVPQGSDLFDQAEAEWWMLCEKWGPLVCTCGGGLLILKHMGLL